jgi:inorganic pyrophosphatase
MMNDNGSGDEKIIAVVNTDPFYKDYRDIKELPNHIIDEIKHFFSVYKQLERNSNVEIETILSSKAAKKIIDESIERYNKKFKY